MAQSPFQSIARVPQIILGSINLTPYVQYLEMETEFGRIGISAGRNAFPQGLPNKFNLLLIAPKRLRDELWMMISSDVTIRRNWLSFYAGNSLYYAAFEEMLQLDEPYTSKGDVRLEVKLYLRHPRSHHFANGIYIRP